MTPFLGEVVGTMILIVFGAGVCANTSLKHTFANGAGWIVIAFGWGFAVAMAAFAVGSFSGAHLNPALTIAFAVIGEFPWADVPTYVAGQFLGAIIGSIIVYLHFLPHWKATEDPGTKLGVFSTGPAIKSPVGNMLSEIIGTFILVLGILAIGANKFADGLNPLIVGFLIVAIGLSLGGTTGYAINPARDLGPRIAHFFLPIPGKGSSNWGYAWVPVVGPILGGSLGAVLYKALFLNEVTYWLWIVIAATVVVVLLTGLLGGSKSSSNKASLNR